MAKRFLYILVPIFFLISFVSAGLTANKGVISYSVQAGAYLQQQNADRMVSLLKSRGYEPYVYQAYNAKRQKLYIVRIGNYKGLEPAISAAAQFKNLEKMPVIVTKFNSITPVKRSFPISIKKPYKKVITSAELAKIDGRAGTIISSDELAKIDGQTGTIMPSEELATVDGQTGSIMPSEELATVDGQTGSIMPSEELATVDGQTGSIMPSEELATVDGQTGSIMPSEELATVDGQTGSVMPSEELATVDGQTGSVMPSEELSTVDGQTGAVIPSGELSTVDGQTGAVIPSGELSTVDGQTGAVIPSGELSTVDGQTGAALPKEDLSKSEPLVPSQEGTEDSFGGMFVEEPSDSQPLDSSSARLLRLQIETLEEKVNELREEADVRKILEITEEEKEEEEDQILSATGRDYTMAPKGSVGLTYSLGYTHNTPDLLQSLDQLPKVEHLTQHTLTNSFSVSYAIRDNISFGVNIPFIYKYDSMGTLNSKDVTDLGDISVNLRCQPLKAGGTLPPLIFSLGYNLLTGRSPYEINPDVELSTGSGSSSLNGGVSLSHKLDPVVVFGGLNFSHGFKVDGLDQKQYGRLKKIEPGQNLSISSGFGYALSYKLTINMSFSLSYSFGGKRIYNWGESPSPESSSSSFSLGTGWRLSPKRAINISFSKGLSRDSADFSINFSMPFNL